MSLLLFLLGIGSAVIAPKDIFPYIDIPVVTIVWTYNGLPPNEMEGRIVTIRERALTTTVNDIEHSESESYQGVSVIRVYFQPTVKVELAVSQITSIVQTILRVLPARHLLAGDPEIRRVQRPHRAARLAARV